MKRLIVSCSIITVAVLLAIANYQLPVTFAQTSSCQNNNRAEGLVSADSLTGKFGNPVGTCIIDPKAIFVPFKIPNYDDLKSLYFDQSKLPSAQKITLDPTKDTLVIDLSSTNRLYHILGDFNISRSTMISGNESGVIFVDGKLTINPDTHQLINGGGAAGLVFVVGGKVIIDPTATRIDAVIISSSTIYTAGDNCTTSNVLVANPLIINGSLISLDSGNPTRFCRSLSSNNQAAEQINAQPKYLVILKDLFSNSIQKWSEITGVTPTPPPSSLPVPPPAPTTYTIANGFSGTQGTNNWYYYYRQNGTISPLVYGNNNMTQWFGANWSAGSWSWGALTANDIFAGDGDRYLIYWKAPSSGTATMTITETRPSWGSTSGDGYVGGVSYSPAVSQFPQTNIVEVPTGAADFATKNIALTKQMLGNGDTLVFSVNPNTSAAADDNKYTISVVFTPSSSPPPPAPNTLTTGLASYWRLDETSGNRIDSVGSNTLTDNNTVTSNPGKQGNAGQFTKTNLESLRSNDTAGLSTGDIDFTWTAWVYMDNKPPAGAGLYIVDKEQSSISAAEYALYYWRDTDRFSFTVYNSSASNIGTVSSNFGSPTLSTWYLITAWHDSVNNQICIAVNNGTANCTATTGVPANTAARFAIGENTWGSNGGHYWDGRIDEVGFWKRILTTAEKDSLFSEGIRW